MTCPRATSEQDIYIDLQYGTITQHGNSRKYMIKLNSNLYGQKQTGRVWKHFLVNKLRSIGFVPFKIDKRVFYHDNTSCIVYVDSGLSIDFSPARLKHLVKETHDTGLNIEDQGHPVNHIEANICKDSHG